MELHKYFEEQKGFGVLATTDSSNKVNIAVYARPHFIDENTVAFIMADRLSHSNLLSNPNATYFCSKKRATITQVNGYISPRTVKKRIVSLLMKYAEGAITPCTKVN